MTKQSLSTHRSFQLMHSFWHMQKSIIEQTQKIADVYGLSATQYNVLMILNHFKVIPQKRLQKEAFLPKSTLSQSINRLVDLNYIKREQIQTNRREIELSITDEGEALISKINTESNSIEKRCQDAVNSLTHTQLQDIITIQQQIATYFED